MLNEKVKDNDEIIIKEVQSNGQIINHIKSKDKYLNGDKIKCFHITFH